MPDFDENICYLIEEVTCKGDTGPGPAGADGEGQCCPHECEEYELPPPFGNGDECPGEIIGNHAHNEIWRDDKCHCCCPKAKTPWWWCMLYDPLGVEGLCNG